MYSRVLKLEMASWKFISEEFVRRSLIALDWDRPTQTSICCFADRCDACYISLQILALTSMSLSDFPLLLDIIGGVWKIVLSNG